MKKIVLITFLIFIFGCINSYAASVKDLLTVGFMPIGRCLYVYGGGWNEEDTGAGAEAVSRGLGQGWKSFYNINPPSYDYKKTRFQIHNGLDCTGYTGWVMYQLFENTYSENGYVFPSSKTARKYTELFDGTLIPKSELTYHQSGDIMGTDGHVFIALGECSDKSIVILNCSPPAVSLCGTAAPNGEKSSEAVSLAKYYMSKYYPECFNKFPNYSRGLSYVRDYDAARWNPSVLSDSDGYRSMTADKILYDLFEEYKIYINGERISFDTKPFAYNGMVYIPIRKICEKTNAEITWNAKTRTSALYYREKSFELNPETAAASSGTHIYPDSVAILNDRIYVSAAFLENTMFDKTVWDGTWKSLYFF